MAINKEKQEFDNDARNYQHFHCKCFINNYEVVGKNILYLAIKKWILLDSFIPRLELKIADDGTFSEVSIPHEGQEINIHIGRTPSDENPITIDFTIVDTAIGFASPVNEITISALLKIDNLFNIKSKSYKKSLSTDVLKDITSNMSVKFNKNVTCKDKMTWLQLNINNFEMIKLVTNKSYITNDDILLTYFDTDYSLNAKSLKNLLNKPPKWELRQDTELATIMSVEEQKRKCKEKGINYDERDIWCCQYDIVNYGGSINTMYGGYGIENHHIKLNNQSLSKNIIDSVDNLINTDDIDVKTPFNKQVKRKWGGVQNDKDSNIHNHYNVTNSVREHIINCFLAQTVEVELNSLSQVQLGETINCHFLSYINPTENNLTISGIYLIVGITDFLTPSSVTMKRVILSRIGYNKSDLTKNPI